MPGQTSLNWVICTTCHERNAPQDEECHICGTELEIADFDDDDIFGIYREDDDFSVFSGRQVQYLSEHYIQWCLNCDSEERYCDCDYAEWLPMEEVQADVFEFGVDAYDPAGMCDSCVFAFTARCEPYRAWLKEWIEKGPEHDHAQLTGCENYRSY